MKLKLLLDQNVSRHVRASLQKLRPDWIIAHVSEMGLASASDDEIIRLACNDGWMMVSFDEDFSDLRRYGPEFHTGIVRLRLDPATVEATETALARLLTAVSDEELLGKLWIVSEQRIRVRSIT